MSESDIHISREQSQTGLSVEELAALVNVSVRTVRFYIAEGLLPGPGARGKAATYGEEHALRLRLIRRLAERRVPLAEMRDLLDRLSLDEARALLAEEDRRATDLRQAEQSPSPKEYVAALLSQARAAWHPAPTVPPAAYAPAPLPAPQAPAQMQPYGAPGQRSAEVWQRWELAPGVELHVRADATARWRKLIERLLRIASSSDQD